MPPADRNLRATVQGRIGLGRAEPPITGIASTAQERSAIAQLRHAVYVAELNKSPSSTADGALGELRDPEDEREGSYLHYVRVGEEVVGTLRSDLYQPGSAPTAFAERFSLDLLPELDDVATSEIARFVIARDFRSSRAAVALGTATYRHGAVDMGYLLSFSMAAPGLVHSYRRFGFQPYAARLISTPDGLRVPLIAVWSDAARLARLGSPFAGLAVRHFGRGRGEAFDPTPIADRLVEQNAPLRTSTPLVRNELERFAATSPAILDGVTRRGLRWLSREAMILDAQAGQLLMRRGLVDRELFVVLDGALTVQPVDGEPLSLGPGEPIGEVALFSDAGARTADVRVSEDATLLVLRRRAISRMVTDVPSSGARFVVNLARCMAERATSSGQA